MPIGKSDGENYSRNYSMIYFPSHYTTTRLLLQAVRGGETYLLQLVTGYRRRIFIRDSLQTSGWDGAAKINTTTTTTTTSLRRAQLRRDEKKSEQRWGDTNYSLEAHKGHHARCKQQGKASPRVYNEPGNRIRRRPGDWGGPTVSRQSNSHEW